MHVRSAVAAGAPAVRRIIEDAYIDGGFADPATVLHT